MNRRKDMEFEGEMAPLCVKREKSVAEFVRWFEMHPNPEALAKRLTEGFSHGELSSRVYDAYKIFASNLRAFRALAYDNGYPARPETIEALNKAIARSAHQHAVSDAVRNALSKPLPLERPMRDVLLRPVALNEPL